MNKIVSLTRLPSRGSLPILREPAICRTRAAANDDALRHPLDHRDVVQDPPSGRLSRDGPPAARKRGRISESATRLAPSLGVVSVVIGGNTARGDTRAYPPRVCTCMYLSLETNARARASTFGAECFRTRGCPDARASSSVLSNFTEGTF